MAYRIEKDFLGEKQIPADKYYGVQTLRGVENFHITGIPMGSEPFLLIAASSWSRVDLVLLVASSSRWAASPVFSDASCATSSSAPAMPIFLMPSAARVPLNAVGAKMKTMITVTITTWRAMSKLSLALDSRSDHLSLVGELLIADASLLRAKGEG